jgi:hypothetical protein
MAKPSIQVFPAGQAIRTPRFAYWHMGIATDQWHGAEQLVISCSGRVGRVVLEPMSVFTAGRGAESMEQPSQLAREVVLSRARQMLGKPYSLFEFNCEHFLFEAFGLARRSPQVAGAVAIAAVFLIFRGA